VFFADSLLDTAEVRGVISHRYLYRAYAENGADGGETSMTQEISAVTWTYPLVNLQKTMENHHFEWENPLLMAIFNSYFDITRG